MTLGGHSSILPLWEIWWENEHTWMRIFKYKWYICGRGSGTGWEHGMVLGSWEPTPTSGKKREEIARSL